MRIGLLGTLVVHDEAGRPVRVGGQRVRMLLILLALDAGRVVPTYSLIEQLWEDEPPANSGNALQSLVSRLRTALRQAGLGDQAIESHPAGYRLAIALGEVDVVAFEALARRGSQALASGDPVTARRVLREALDIWRGPALADASAARFASGPAARLGELRARATLDMVEAGLALGESDGLIGELRAMIAADPVAERPRGLLMRALYAAGRQAEALAVYTQARDLLASELGVDPSPQLEQIYLGVLRQDLHGGPGSLPQPDGPPPGTPGEPSPSAERLARGDSRPGRPAGVRKPLTSFVGRDEDVTRVLKMLAEGRLVTLTGPGGAGKTRLAIETAARLAGDSPAGDAGAVAAIGQAGEGRQVWLVELTPVTDPAEVPSAVLATLSIRESPVIARGGAGQRGALADPAQRLVAALAERHGLLILDNCEHVVAAAAAVADQVLADCPRVRVLATSREPLRITGEALWPVQPLPVPPAPADEPGQQAPDGIAPPDGIALLDGAAPADGSGRDGPVADASSDVAGYASVRLLADRAAAVRPDFQVDAANADDVARICRALDGMPLAIELAAARLRTLSAAQLAQRLGARFELLTGGSRTAVPRHQTLRGVVDWSWELLSGPEQVLARRLAAFPGGATLTVAEQVCHDAALPVEAVLPAIFGLVEKSFLIVAGNGEPRYRMLETIRAYCAERLTEAGEEDQVRRAFATHFLRLAETADPQLRAASQNTWLRRLTAEQDNIHAAVRWAIDQRDAALALSFGEALAWFWLLRGRRRESGALAGEILAISEATGLADPAGDAGAGDGTGRHHQAAIAHVRAPAPDGAGRDPAVVQARAVCALSALNASWDIATVRQPLAEAESLLPRPGGGGSGRPLHPMVAVGASMLALYEKQDPDQSLELIATLFESGDPWTRAAARLVHALSSLNQGRVDGVARQCAEGLAGFSEIGDRWGMALAHVGQAELALYGGEYTEAIAGLERAVELCRALTDWEDTAQMYGTLAKARSRQGDYDGALADIARAERAAREQGDSESDLWVAYVKAELAWLQGDLAEAGRLARQLDARMAAKNSAMIWPFRAQAQNRAALADIKTGDAAAGWAGLAGALRFALDGQERAAVAVVVDGLAAATLWTDAGPAGAERAAVLLGTAHSMRGVFDHSSLDAPRARDAARRTLGDAAFDAAYQRGRALSYEDAITFAEDCARSHPNR